METGLDPIPEEGSNKSPSLAPWENITRGSSLEEDASTTTSSVVSESMDVDADCHMHQHLLENPGKWGISNETENNYPSIEGRNNSIADAKGRDT